MFKAITATSTKTCDDDIVADLVGQAHKKLGIYRPSSGIFYASGKHQPEKLYDVLRGICKAFPGIEVLGGTVIGGFTDSSGYVKDGYFLCLMLSDTTQLVGGCIGNISELLRTNTFQQEFRAKVHASVQNNDIAACLFYSPYNNVDGNVLIDTLEKELPEKCLVFGGMATDHWTEQDLATFSKKTPPADNSLLFFAKDDEVRVDNDSLVFLLFKGKLTAQSRTSYGWSDIGMLYPGKAENSVLTELDGKDPHLFLKEMQHPLAADEGDHAQYSLWFHVPGKDPFIRDIFFDKASCKYFTRGSRLPSHFDCSFSYPQKENILNEFQNSINMLTGHHALVLAITCCTHQVVMKKEISKEHEAMVSRFPSTPIIAGYVFGEFGPSLTDPKNAFHSCSSVIVCLGEHQTGTDEESVLIKDFLHTTINEQGKEIASLNKQVAFLESEKHNRMKLFAEDCLGIMLCHSPKSLSSIGEKISQTLRAYYTANGLEPPYAISRNRVIEQLMQLKKRGEILLGDSTKRQS
jgi:hypothetical protein